MTSPRGGRRLPILDGSDMSRFNTRLRLVAGVTITPVAICNRESRVHAASNTRRSAFTLIEMMIVVAIIAIISAIAIPALINFLGHGNEQAAVESLRTVAAAQSVYRSGDLDANGVGDYAPSLQELAAECSLNGISDPCGVPDPNIPFFHLPPSPSYAFQMLGTEPPPTPAFRALAAPTTPLAGSLTFTIDETGKILAATGKVPTLADTVIDEGSGMASACAAGCAGDITISIPDLAEIAAFDAALGDLATNTIVEIVSLIAPGQLTPEPDPIGDAAAVVADTALVEEPFLQGLDTDGSGVDFSSILNADLFGWSRTLAATLPTGGAPSPTVADDAAVAARLATYQDNLATALSAGLDPPQPKVPSAGLPGDPVAFLLAILALATPGLGAGGLLLLTLGFLAVGTATLSLRKR